MGTLYSMLTQPSLNQQSSSPRGRLSLRQGAWHPKLFPKNFHLTSHTQSPGLVTCFKPHYSTLKTASWVLQQSLAKKAAGHTHNMAQCLLRTSPVWCAEDTKTGVPASKCQRVQLGCSQLLKSTCSHMVTCQKTKTKVL